MAHICSLLRSISSTSSGHGASRAGSVVVLAAASAVTLAACTQGSATADAALPTTPATLSSDEVVLITHDSFAVSKGVLEEFTEQTGVKVKLVQSGDAGEIVNKAVLAKGNPQGDVLFGLDNTFLSRAVDAGILAPHAAVGLDDVPAELVPAGGVATPIDRGDVCVNIDEEYFEGKTAPTSLDDLVDPAFKGLTAVQNPSTSSPGLAFMLATIAAKGEDGWIDWWTQLKANDVAIVDGWEAAYYGEFSGGSGEGDRPIVVSYASSPAAEVVFAEPTPESAPTSALLDTCFRQVEYAALLEGAENADAGRALIDFMLSKRFQEDIPLQMFVYPANSKAELPEVFTDNAAVPPNPLSLDPATIAAERDAWLRQWREAVEG
jgi:thiamine transport system substrate-binding protein